MSDYFNLSEPAHLLHNIAELERLPDSERIEEYKKLMDRGYILAPLTNAITYLKHLDSPVNFEISEQDFEILINATRDYKEKLELANLVAKAYHFNQAEISEAFYEYIREHSDYLIEYWGYIVILHI